MVGPTTMRRVLKMSGLKASAVEGAPVIRRNPDTIITAAMPIRMKLMRCNGSCDAGSFISRSSMLPDVFLLMSTFGFICVVNYIQKRLS